MMVAPSAAYAETFSTPQNISSPLTTGIYPTIASNNSGIYVTWHGADNITGNFDIFFAKSTDGGVTWSGPQNITNTPEVDYYPKIAVDGMNVYVTWEGLIGTNNYETYFMMSSDGGATWSPVQNISNTPLDGYIPSITYNNSGIYVVWHEHTSSDYDVFFTKSTDGGLTWSPSQVLADTSSTSVTTSITTDGSNLYVTWSEDVGSASYETYFSKSIDGGVTWSTPQNVSNFPTFPGSPFLPTQPSISSDTSGIYLTWNHYDGVDFDYYFSKSIDGGATWSAPQVLVTMNTSNYNQSLSSANSELYVTWQNLVAPGNDDIFFSKSTDGGSTWNTQNISNTAITSVLPSIVADDTNINVVWLEAGPSSSIFFTNTVVPVSDTTPPVITLLGNDPETVEANTSYTDAGATAADDTDGDITASIVTGGLPIDTSTLGSNIVTYDVSDNAGNAAVQVTRTVNVVDTTAPTITAPADVTLEAPTDTTPANTGSATATDTVDPAPVISFSDVNSLDAQGLGTIDRTWSATDASGNTATTTQTITVVEPDTTPIVSISATPLSGLEPLTVDFTSTVTGGNGPLTYSWDFGDGESLFGNTDPSHIYDAGVYIATLTVTDQDGDVGSDSVQITVDVPVITPSQAIQNLIDTVLSMNIHPGTENSLISNLDSAIDKLTDDNPNNDSAACGQLSSFVDKVNAQDGKKLTAEQAETLRELATNIESSIGCI